MDRRKESLKVNTLYRPELLYSNGAFIANGEILVSESGQILQLLKSSTPPQLRSLTLPGKALLPGFVNTHSHSFQRLIRGKSESRMSAAKISGLGVKPCITPPASLIPRTCMTSRA